MASPQTEGGYTRLANELLDALILFGFSKRQIKIVLCVIRKTYGFNKKSDTISNGEFARATGLSRQHVIATVSELASMSVLIVEKSGVMVRGGEVNRISINKDYEQWGTSPKTGPVTSPESGTSPVVGLVPKQFGTSPKTGPVTSPKTGPSKDKRKDSPKESDVSARFERWYQHYPRKVAKGQARKAFAKLNPDELMVDRMIEAIETQKKAKAAAESRGEWWPDWKHPATWLNAESWEDEIDTGDTDNNWRRVEI